MFPLQFFTLWNITTLYLQNVTFDPNLMFALWLVRLKQSWSSVCTSCRRRTPLSSSTCRLSGTVHTLLHTCTHFQVQSDLYHCMKEKDKNEWSDPKMKLILEKSAAEWMLLARSKLFLPLLMLIEMIQMEGSVSPSHTYTHTHTKTHTAYCVKMFLWARGGGRERYVNDRFQLVSLTAHNSSSSSTLWKSVVSVSVGRLFV